MHSRIYLAVFTPLLLVLPWTAFRLWIWDAARPALATEEQALARSVPLCRALAHGEAGDLRLAATPLRFGDGEKRMLRAWIVDCTDAHGKPVASLDWDAITGDLQMASRPSLSLPEGRLHTPLLKAQGVRATAEALRELGFTRPAKDWRLLRSRRYGSAWWATWQAIDRRAVVAVDAVTGEMRMVQVLPIVRGESRRE